MRISLLSEALRRFRRPNTYSPGEFVTPVPESTLKGAGEPYVVIDSCSAGNALRDLSGMASDPDFGGLLNVRIAKVVHHGDDLAVVTHWVEHWHIEPYTVQHHEEYEDRMKAIVSETAKATRQADRYR
jgi:hypothetical protein